MNLIFNKLLLISITILPMLVFSIVTEQHSIFIGFFIFAFISLIRKKELAYSDTNVIFGIILAIIMGVAINYSVKDSYKYFHYIAAIFFGNVALISMFFTSVIITFFKYYKILIGINSTLAMAGLFYMNNTGNGISKLMMKMLKESPFITYNNLFFILCIAEFIIIFFAFTMGDKFNKNTKEKRIYLKRSIICISFLSTLIISYFLITIHLRYAGNLQVIERTLVNLISRSRARQYKKS